MTKTRTEHLTEKDKIRSKMPRTPLHSFLGIAQNEQVQQAPGQASETVSAPDSNSEVKIIATCSHQNCLQDHSICIGKFNMFNFNCRKKL